MIQFMKSVSMCTHVHALTAQAPHAHAIRRSQLPHALRACLKHILNPTHSTKTHMPHNTRACTHKGKHAQAHAHTRTYKHMHTQAHAYTISTHKQNAHTSTCTHTHIILNVPPIAPSIRCEKTVPPCAASTS